MRVIAERVMLAWGWPRRFIALAAGMCGALAMPPLFLFPFMVVALCLAVWLLDGTETGRSRWSPRSLFSAAALGWLFGFGYFVAGLWWLGAAFLVEAEEFLWALPLGVVGLPAVLALFHAVGFMVARLFWSAGTGRLFALALGLGGAELARGIVFTGFPWNLIGQVFGVSLVTLQSVSLIGIEGLTFLAILIGALPAVLISGRSLFGRVAAGAVSVALLGIMIAYGSFRLATAPVPGSPSASVPDIHLRIMQPNLTQAERNRSDGGEEILKSYLALSDRAASPDASGLGDVTHLIWPESPFPFLLSEAPDALRMIGDALPDKAMLLTGAVRAERGQEGSQPKFFNTLHVIGSDGSIVDSYDKLHLVPFGEYLPAFADSILRSVGLRQFVSTPGGFNSGALAKRLEPAGTPPFLPLICYEAIFPVEFNGNLQRPSWLVNITNDAWFGDTFGPHQHFELARLRAIETGLPLVRAANSGISAVIDPFGRVVDQLGVGVRGVLDTTLPKEIGPTVHVTYGRAPIWGILLVCFVFAISACIRRA